jgi:hypothetical protein
VAAGLSERRAFSGRKRGTTCCCFWVVVTGYSTREPTKNNTVLASRMVSVRLRIRVRGTGTSSPAAAERNILARGLAELIKRSSGEIATAETTPSFKAANAACPRRGT